MTDSKTDRLPSVCKWLRMTQDQVLDKFYGLPQAFSDGEGQKRFVYVPGTRTDRVLLVAHADTVWGNTNINFGFQNNIIFSLDRSVKHEVSKGSYTVTKHGKGIGADDRAGCAILWYLRSLGHSLLITSGEEQGCIGSRYLMNSKWWREELNKNHMFAIQFDRRGQKDLVFYDVGTKKFVEYVKKQTGYVPAQGSYTDIRQLCIDMCGVNISVGYYSEHQSEEKLVYDQWLNTLHTTHEWLNKPNIPRHDLDKSDKYYGPSYSYNNNTKYGGNMGHGNYSDDYGYQDTTGMSSVEESYTQKKANGSRPSNKVLTTSSDVGTVLTKASGQVVVGNNELMMCPYCYHKMIDQEWYENQFSCTSCDKSF